MLRWSTGPTVIAHPKRCNTRALFSFVPFFLARKRKGLAASAGKLENGFTLNKLRN